jgi:acyl carrier protein
MRIGVDLMSVSRFATVAEHRRYRTLVFTAAELAQALELGPERYLERLAGRFCVKEATCKVLGRGFGQGVRWRDIEVTSDPWGAPGVTLSGGARQLADEAELQEVFVTLSHQADLVIAIAVAASGRAPRPYLVVPDGHEEKLAGADDSRLDEVAVLAAELFAVSPEEVSRAASFADDLGATPLLTIELLASLERRHRVEIRESDFYRMTNLRRTYQAVASAADW